MKRILAQCSKELAQFKRDRLTVLLAFILPLGMLLIYGFAIRLEIKNINLSVQDFDNTSFSRSYIERLYATNQFIPVPFREGGLDRGDVKATVIIPPKFYRDFQSKNSSIIQVQVDGTDVNNARVIQNSLNATNNFFLQSSQDNTPQVKIQPDIRIWFNPGRKESLYIVPGVYAVILWVFPSMLTAIAMVREKEEGTIAQVYASDLSAIEWLLGKGLAYFLVSIIEAFVLITFATVIFQVPIVDNILILIIGTLTFLAASVSFGLFFGVRAKNQTGAVQGTSILGFLTAFLLSGFIYPISNIPFPISLLSNIVPARYYIILTRDVFVRGTGWSSVWYVPILLSIVACFFLFICSRILKNMQFSD
jgi:ABC-2 type transport system permease protein